MIEDNPALQIVFNLGRITHMQNNSVLDAKTDSQFGMNSILLFSYLYGTLVLLIAQSYYKISMIDVSSNQDNILTPSTNLLNSLWFFFNAKILAIPVLHTLASQFSC